MPGRSGSSMKHGSPSTGQQQQRQQLQQNQDPNKDNSYGNFPGGGGGSAQGSKEVKGKTHAYYQVGRPSRGECMNDLTAVGAASN